MSHSPGVEGQGKVGGARTVKRLEGAVQYDPAAGMFAQLSHVPPCTLCLENYICLLLYCLKKNSALVTLFAVMTRSTATAVPSPQFLGRAGGRQEAHHSEGTASRL